MAITLKDLMIGFVAAALAVVTVHQGIVFILNQAGALPSKPWSLAPTGPLLVPTIVNQMFWGGVWGMIYVLIYTSIPASETWLKGLLFGLVVVVIGNFLLVPFLKGQPLFAAFDGNKIAILLAIHLGFGIATALIYDKLRTLL